MLAHQVEHRALIIFSAFARANHLALARMKASVTFFMVSGTSKNSLYRAQPDLL